MTRQAHDGRSGFGGFHRRAIVAGAASSLVGRAYGQSAPPKRIGILYGIDTEAEAKERADRIAAALSRAGWDVGRSIVIDVRVDDGVPERAKRSADELVALRPDVLVARTTAAARALRNATSTIPIVFYDVTDPIGARFTSNFARPDQNMTGFVDLEPAIGAKWISLLREVSPTVRRVCLIQERRGSYGNYFLPVIRSAATEAGLVLDVMEVETAADLEPAISRCGGDPPGAAILLAEVTVRRNIDRVVKLLADHRVVAIFDATFIVVRRGGLMAYTDGGVSSSEIVSHVVSLLGGTKISGIPIRTPTRFTLALNARAADALGISLPTSLIAAADIIAQ